MALLGRRRWPLIAIVLIVATTIFIFRHSQLPSVTTTNPWRHEITIDDPPTLDAAAKDKHGFLSSSAADALCTRHNFETYPERSRKRKIFDLILLDTQLDWLEIRLNELRDHVDFFVIVESSMTSTGTSKPLLLKENWKRFKPFHKQIILRALDDSTLATLPATERRDLHRNALFDQVLAPGFKPSKGVPGLTKNQTPESGDILLVSDVDEIPKPTALELLRNCVFPRRLTLRSRLYQYSFQWLHHGPEWPHPQATFFQGADTIRPVHLRTGAGSDGGRNLVQSQLDKGDLWNASWYCSTCQSTVREVIDSMASVASTIAPHQRDDFLEPGWVAHQMRLGHDLFDRKGETNAKMSLWEGVDGNWDLPRYLQTKENRIKFDYLLDRDAPNANLRDLTDLEAQAWDYEQANLGRSSRTAKGRG